MSDLETLERTRPAPRPSVVKKPEASLKATRAPKPRLAT